MKIEHFKNQLIPLSGRYHAYAYGILKNDADAADVVQDLFSKMWTNTGLDQVQNLESWSFRVLHNICIDRIRAEKKRREKAKHLVIASRKSAQPADNLQYQELLSKLETCLAKLPPIQKRVFELRELSGLDYKGIAKELDISMDKVKVYLFRARSEIRHHFISWQIK